MLTAERHRIILKLLTQNNTVKLQELVDKLKASESTIRRDLVQLEKENKLRRVHGGASLINRLKDEPSMAEKETRNLSEKKLIAAYAASLIQDRDCIYLDAGSTIFQIIPHIVAKEITVVTNGVSHVNALLEQQIETYLLGGFIKPRTSALVGQLAIDSLQKYRFDKTYLGVNGIHLNLGYTTPDPEEAAIKSLALKQGKDTYVLADHSKFDEVTFSHIADLEDAVIITNKNDVTDFQDKTRIEVVSK